MGNEFMTLVKDTSLAQIIAVVEISALASKLQNAEVSIVPVFIAGVFYLIMNAVVSKCFSTAEKNWIIINKEGNPMAESVLSAENICKSFGPKRSASGHFLSCESGEVFL